MSELHVRMTLKATRRLCNSTFVPESPVIGVKQSHFGNTSCATTGMVLCQQTRVPSGFSWTWTFSFAHCYCWRCQRSLEKNFSSDDTSERIKLISPPINGCILRRDIHIVIGVANAAETKTIRHQARLSAVHSPHTQLLEYWIDMVLLHMQELYQGILTGCIVGVVLHIILRRKSPSYPYPPGPRPRPVIGNIFDLPSSFPWLTFMDWSERYNSDIVHFKVGSSSTIVLNSLEVATELLEKRGKIYSSRPSFPMLNFIGFGWTFVIMPYGPRWYAQRRLFTKEFNANLPERYEPQVQKAVSEMLGRLFRAPEDFVGHIRHMAGTVIMDVTYGIQVLPSNDPYIEEAERALVGFVSAAIPGSFWLDYFPFLKYVPSWFPGASFKVKAKNWRRDASIMVNHPYDDVKERMARGTLEPCFVYHCLQSDDLDEKRTENDGVDASKAVEVHEKDIQQTAATMYGAGTDTIVAALQSFFLAILLNPDIQRKAQEELDRVVAKSGPERLPDFKDRESLPYITAIMYEVFRSQPVNPLGIAHLSTEDDVYKGYYIPKGSVVIGNIWAIFHDPKTYPDPNKFDPDRWVISGPTGIPEKLNPHLREPTAHFGFGRRLCAGKHLALSSIWLTIASVLFTYDISKADGESEPTGEYKSSLVNYPAPFKCKITPRSPSHEELVSLSSIDV